MRVRAFTRSCVAVRPHPAARGGHRTRVAAAIGWLIAALAAAAADPAPAAEEDEAPLLGPEPPAEAPLPLEPVPLPEGAPWRPPLPAPGASDWLRLTSGEWVRGEIEGIEDDTVYFDSDQLDDLEIDWVDVASLRSGRRNTYRFVGRQVVTGTAGMHGDVVRIDTGEEIREFPRHELYTMIQGDLREINYWSLDLGLGVTLREGNSDQRDVSGNLAIVRETPLTETRLAYQGAVSTVEDEEITNNQRLFGSFAYYVSQRFFVQAPFAEAFRDRFQNIDLRATVGAGVGYEVMDRSRADWQVVLGGGYQRTLYDEAQEGDADRADDAAVIVGTTLELDPTPDWEWDTSYQLNLVVTDLDKTNHHLRSVLSFDLFGPVDLDVEFTWDRIEGPQPVEGGERPESDDFRTTVGLSIDL